MAAYSVHYSNGINVMNFDGDYGTWMDASWMFITMFRITMWSIPAIGLIYLFKKQEKKRKDWILVGATSALPIFASWPVYTFLINFWERNWISPV